MNRPQLSTAEVVGYFSAEALGLGRPVAFYRCGDRSRPPGHDHQTKMMIARSLADLLGVEFAGELDLQCQPASVFVVPSDTLESLEQARRIGITGAGDLFGGVVPHPFVATKVITHPLLHADAAAPEGWSTAFGASVRGAVLPGCSVFTVDDALRAGERLLKQGAVRVKEPGGVGGGGQYVVRNRTELQARVGAIDPAVLQREGLVLERNLNDVTTRSVGQVQVGRWTASYCGTQHLTRNHRNDEVYGGSRLTVVRGGYDDLLGLALAPAQRTAVEQALTYHRSALQCFAGLMVSRSNYDVAQGRDDAGQACSGVLVQSWRIGGASGAEVAALHAFRADPGLQVVHASTTEIYGEGVTIPAGARVHYDGIDEHVGRLTKYARVEPYGDA